MNILYLVFGQRISDHLQAHLSIRTFLQQAVEGVEIYVITTAPQFYTQFSRINVIAITDETLREWEGPMHFFWRVKIKAIEYMAQHFPGRHLCYLDSDTFLTGSLAELKQQLDMGKGMMHLDEGHPMNMKTKSLRMWKRVAGHTYGGVTLGPRHDMWNAGVVAVPASQLNKVVSLALQLCDGMLADEAERVVIEQYSLSIALFEVTGLQPALPWIGHYWGNKDEWNALAQKFFLESYMTGRTFEQEIEALPSLHLENIPVYVKKSNTRRRLTNFIAKLFPDKRG